MTSSEMIQPKFLSKGDELGVVAVGFSGGQVSVLYSISLVLLVFTNKPSANQELTQHLLP